jgi:hypothetical protein
MKVRRVEPRRSKCRKIRNLNRSAVATDQATCDKTFEHAINVYRRQACDVADLFLGKWQFEPIPVGEACGPSRRGSSHSMWATRAAGHDGRD